MEGPSEDWEESVQKRQAGARKAPEGRSGPGTPRRSECDELAIADYPPCGLPWVHSQIPSSFRPGRYQCGWDVDPVP
ncbi:hypothetical protein GCM10009838_35080 [Catenulispora subtropica]|uniref:Uncharacterized protein n=1 Tax=Catenulispora subtropica TaxID=450798 RepID=A0ABN2RNZ9_9ACTN